MSFASLVFQLGVNATAAVAGFAHLLLLLILPRALCGTGSASEPWAAAAATGVLLLLLLILAGGARPLLRGFRWVLAAQAVMALWAVPVLLPYFLGSTVSGFALCAVHQGAPSGEAGIAARAWVPFELAVLALLWLRAVQSWRR